MKTNRIWLVANWKMHGNAAEVRHYMQAMGQTLDGGGGTLHFIYCPPAPYLALAAGDARIMLGAQNCHAGTSGAHTGEISAAMLADIGCRYVILGHSERRALGETDADIIAKAQAAITAGLIPILCIGESAQEYAAGQTTAALDRQLIHIKSLRPCDFLIAYEPVWAIGSGLTPTFAEIMVAHAHIKSVLGSETSVLYGGSVNAGNAGEILRLPGVSGALIGSASLSSASMCTIIAAARG